jgi:hypothetical protein
MPGAVYAGLVVGVSDRQGAIHPLKATWPDAKGNFSLLLPPSARGMTVAFWESYRQFFTASGAKPGTPIDPSVYPHSVAADAPQGIATAKLPG